MGRLTDIGLKELEEVLSAWQKQDSLPADVGQCVFPKQLRSVRWAMITENVKNDDTARGEAFISITSDLIKRKWEETSQVTPKSPVAERWSVLLHYVVLQTSAKDTAMALHISLRTLYRRFAEAKPLLLFALRSKDQGLVAGVTYYDEFHDRLKQTDGHLERPKETDAYWALLQGGEERSSSRAVIIEGSPGVGKTSLGLSLARKYQNEKGGTVFWHTFNDSPNSLEDLAVHSSAFFALQGDLRLWHALQLGKKPDDVIHVFLASANGGNSLLCFDNCHQAEGSHVTQTLLTQLCESMCPVILISRETPLLPERLLGRKLGGMTSSQALNVLRRSGIRIAAASSSFRTLYSKTGGNPQLIGLCGRLMTDMPADNWASFLNCMPSRELVWSYIVRNFLNTLDSGERDVISSLVFIFGGKADKQALCISVGTSSAIDSIQRLTRKNVLKELSDGSVETCDILTDLHKQLGPTYFGINSSELRKRHLRVAKNETINGRLISA
ncbi:MAG: hypothetical protein FJ004_08110, partial [Chloroflexi bacterium]|nr:hypothetical protein [Chloroflexota bacterium]